jgi:hypothetical protein
MNFKVGDEVECIKDAAWQGHRDYCRVGDKAVLRRRDFKGTVEIFEMEIIKGWHAGQTVPISVANIGTYFKLAQEPQAKYKIGMRVIAQRNMTIDNVDIKRGETYKVVMILDDLYKMTPVNPPEKLFAKEQYFVLYGSQLDMDFTLEPVNPCPPSLRKWLENVQTQRS